VKILGEQWVGEGRVPGDQGKDFDIVGISARRTVPYFGSVSKLIISTEMEIVEM